MPGVPLVRVGTRGSSRPAESHRQPLTEPSVRLSPHSAPIRQTHQSSRSANVQNIHAYPSPAVLGTDSLGLCGVEALELTHRPCHKPLIDVSQRKASNSVPAGCITNHHPSRMGIWQGTDGQFIAPSAYPCAAIRQSEACGMGDA